MPLRIVCGRSLIIEKETPSNLPLNRRSTPAGAEVNGEACGLADIYFVNYKDCLPPADTRKALPIADAI
jgi:hypothetical protein